MYVCVRAFECVRSGKKNTADSHLAMDGRLHFFFPYVAMKHGADLNTTGGILSPASGLTVQQVVLTLRLKKRPLVSHFDSYRTGLRNIPKRKTCYLLDLTVRISKQPLVEPVGLLIMDTGLMVKFVEEKKNASLSLLFSSKLKQEKRRTSLKALAGSDEIDKSVSRVSPNLTNLRSWNPELERTLVHCT